jgi:hypothetical protein
MTVLQFTLNPESSQDQLTKLLTESAKWQPQGYKPEIATRMRYLDGNMRDDLLEVLKAEFENTWEHMQRSIVSLPMVSHIISKKATVFEGSGRFFLVDPNKEEIDADSDEAQAFQDMINESLVWMALKRADEVVELAHSAALKVWWDNDHVTVSTFNPNLVDILPDPNRELDPYNARAVLFQRTGIDGIRSAARHEIWGAEDQETASDIDAYGQPIFDPTVHFISDGKNSWSTNENNENPFKDPATGRSIYPYAWLVDNRDSLYKSGGNHLVEMNRIVNWGLTYLHHGMNWMSIGIPVFEKDPGSNVKLPQNRIVSPKHALALPANVRFSFVRNEINLGAITNTYELLMKYHAMMSGIDPANLAVDQGQARSGFAIKLEMSGLEKHRAMKIPLYKPNVIHLLNVMIIVHNYYAELAGKTKIHEDFEPDWSPGEMDAGPVDFVELGNRYEKEIEFNVSSIDDWTAAVHGVDKPTAQKMVDENAERNAEILKKGTRFPDEPEAAAAGAESIRRLTTLDTEAIETPEETAAQAGVAGLVGGEQ